MASEHMYSLQHPFAYKTRLCAHKIRLWRGDPPAITQSCEPDRDGIWKSVQTGVGTFTSEHSEADGCLKFSAGKVEKPHSDSML